MTTALLASSVTCVSPNVTRDGAAPATMRDGSPATFDGLGPLIEKNASANAAAAAAGTASQSHLLLVRLSLRISRDAFALVTVPSATRENTLRSTRAHATSDSRSTGGGPSFSVMPHSSQIRRIPPCSWRARDPYGRAASNRD